MFDEYDWLEQDILESEMDEEDKKIKKEEIAETIKTLSELHHTIADKDIRNLAIQLYKIFPYKNVPTYFIKMINESFQIKDTDINKYSSYAKEIDINSVNSLSCVVNDKLIEIDVALNIFDFSISDYYMKKVKDFYKENLKEQTTSLFGKDMEKEIYSTWFQNKKRSIFDKLFEVRTCYGKYGSFAFIIWEAFKYGEEKEKFFKDFFIK